jgi:hypothetical protein
MIKDFSMHCHNKLKIPLQTASAIMLSLLIIILDSRKTVYHALPKYATNPIAKSLSVVSRKKTTVKIRSK